MKANELRIGNLVFIDTHIELERVSMRIESISYNALSKEHYSMVFAHSGDRFNFSYYPFVSQMKPIPLSEEILLKCGFAYNHPKSRDSFSLGNIHFLLNDGDSVIGNGLYMNGYRVADIKYLHELQNLYFAITGEELKVEL